ncbi:hypothetical protein COEREDRAFT_41809 [Coemansia reversa NRRL 1564]|uniref:Uncharacterized protein n=1 Tax=Coemansia reversa (strain ATCC 12441 / NRRL 1564) TaxID=763665 RepID=A0A2G5BCR7_COERN|nr:hypothetical protein COEREDRAFT_41809 [Coemansia reversa NRRL 1564]|eukprot:PIA16808.1 hypothetical protein COEREDRAFT_41809 [Coemansia reversa NRRL 1564]
MSVGDRMVTMTLVSGGCGAVLGGYLGAQQASRQYLAERAHRLPKTVEGWFFYHKWKNYRVTMGSVRGAFHYAPRLAGCVLMFAAAEALLDRVVGEPQIANTVVASSATAIFVSTVSQLPKSSARRARRAGLAVGLLVGAAQDLASWKAGSPPSYFKSIREHLWYK